MNSKAKDIPKAIIKGDVAYIPLVGKRGGYAIVDKENSWIDMYSWSQNIKGYPQSYINKKTIKMHAFLFGTEIGLVNDHINRNKLDNRKNNIRKTSYTINSRNVSLASNNKSGRTGVNWDKGYKRWQARISVNRHIIKLGYFENKEDAIKARQEAETKYWKD
jgi:hypothetical protein